jgi:hypothetical protein
MFSISFVILYKNTFDSRVKSLKPILLMDIYDSSGIKKIYGANALFADTIDILIFDMIL